MSKRKSKVQLGKIYRIEDPSGQAHFGMPYKAYKKKRKYETYFLFHLRIEFLEQPFHFQLLQRKEMV